ncbi:hypothetical protein V491_03800 [Pseudogymnoascus sp. VKM F-3775]|nr:hypothetical protein V491_03800 [Pseudogymnoascus sp. VKM F-3775]
MSSVKARRMPLKPTDRANQAVKLPGSLDKKAATHDSLQTKNAQIQNAESRNRVQHEYEIYEDAAPHADPELFHELVEEPDLVFGEDIDALGVTHAGQPDTRTSTRKTPPTAAGNAAKQARQGKRQTRNTDTDVHADPALFHELVEEPDLVFADDIYALGVTHAGTPDPPRLTRKLRRAAGNTRQTNEAKRYIRVRRARPNADDLYWDDSLIHEIVEEPEYIFGEDIDALGVYHAGVPNNHPSGSKASRSTGNTGKPARQRKRYARVIRVVPSTDDLHWDDDVMHEVVEEPDAIFGEDIDALGVYHAGVPNSRPSGSKASRSTGNTGKPAHQRKRYVRVKRAVPSADDLHWDDDVMHEVVEEPDAIFGEDIDALGVYHAGVPNSRPSGSKASRSTGNTGKPARQRKRYVRVKRVVPSADDLHWDDDVMHEVVEEPDAIFGEDIDALGVTHAGVPDISRSTKQTVRKVTRNAARPVHGSRHKLRRQHADPRLFHELVEEPDVIFGDDIDALGVAHAGVPNDFDRKRVEISVGGVRLNVEARDEETLVTIKFPATMQSG